MVRVWNGYSRISTVPTYALLDWCDDLKGNIYDGQGTATSNNFRLILEQYLNPLVKVAAGNNYLTSTPAITADGGGITRGCLAPRTSLPLKIIVLFVTFSIFLVAILVDFILGYGFKMGGTLHHDYPKDETPKTLLDWMAQSVREHISAELPTTSAQTMQTDHCGMVGSGPRSLEISKSTCGRTVSKISKCYSTNYRRSPIVTELVIGVLQ